MAEIVSLIVDIGLGALAYRMARDNRYRTTALEARQARTEFRLTRLEAKEK